MSDPTPANLRHEKILRARRKHAAKGGSVMTRQRRRAELRAQWYANMAIVSKEGTRKERRMLARAGAAGQFKEDLILRRSGKAA